MNKINLARVPMEQGRSPKGRYRRSRQDISLALAGVNGLGKAGVIEELTVAWPSGKVSKLTNVPVDRVMTIEEPR